MNKKKYFGMIAVLMFALVFAVAAVPQAQAAGPLPDIDGHWAELQIEYMLSQDNVGGYPDGTFKPENTITRAEFMKIINNVFGFTATAPINFTDVSANDWYASEIAKAVAAGYITGYPDGSIKPNAVISRQEAALMIAKAAKLDLSSADLSKFTDASGIPDWAKAAVAACVKAGYINGYPDGSFQGDKFITRAEAMVIALNTLPKATVFDTAGTNGPASGTTTITGDVIITVPGVILKNTIITGDLLIAQNVGQGSVNLNNVVVQGNTLVNGGTINTGEPPAVIGGGGGGGGGATTTAVTAINVTMLNKTETVTSGAVTFDLTDQNDLTAISDLTITTTPADAIAGAKLTIKQINARDIDFIAESKSITTTIPNTGKVTVAAILGILAQDNDVSLGSLRTVLGTGDVVVTGTLSKTGYTFNSGNDMTITITLGALTGNGTETISNDYFTIEKTGTKTATVTITDLGATTTVGTLKGNGVDFAAVVASFVGGVQYNGTQSFEDAASVYSSAAFDALELGKLIDKTLTFDGYTVKFVAEH